MGKSHFTKFVFAVIKRSADNYFNYKKFLYGLGGLMLILFFTRIDFSKGLDEVGEGQSQYVS